MKLILSSCDFGNPESRKAILDNLPKAISDCCLLFIPNEKATTEIIENDLYTERMCKHGFSRENVFIFDHTKPEKFRNLPLDVIYISGGNTFGTLDKIRKCNFDTDIINYVKSGVTYIGGSAGAHIVTRNIEHVSKYDENNVGITDFSGLGLYDGILICHYTYHRKQDLDKLIQESEFNVDYMTDNDYIIYTPDDI